MLNKVNTNIERIIAKIDNDFNPDTSDWIPRVAAWCIDAVSMLKVLPTERKQIKLKVHNRIAYSVCTFDVFNLKVFDKNGCEIEEINNLQNNECCSSTGDKTETIGNKEVSSSTINKIINNNPNSVPDYTLAETINTNSLPSRYNIHNFNYDKKINKNYIVIDDTKIELTFDTDYIIIEYDAVKLCKSIIYKCDVPVIPNNGLLIEAVTAFCMYKMLCRGYKHPVFNLSASQYGTNPYYMWTQLKDEAKRSVIIDMQGDTIDNSNWKSVFYNFTFDPKK